jgi:hypothetical protein
VRIHDVLADARYGHRRAPTTGCPNGHLPVRSYLAVPSVRPGRRADGQRAACSSATPEPGVVRPRGRADRRGIASQRRPWAIENARLYAAAQAEDRGALNRAFRRPRPAWPACSRESLLPVPRLPQIPRRSTWPRATAPAATASAVTSNDVFPLARGLGHRHRRRVRQRAPRRATSNRPPPPQHRAHRRDAARPPGRGAGACSTTRCWSARSPAGSGFCTAIFGILEPRDDGNRALHEPPAAAIPTRFSPPTAPRPRRPRRSAARAGCWAPSPIPELSDEEVVPAPGRHAAAATTDGSDRRQGRDSGDSSAWSGSHATAARPTARTPRPSSSTASPTAPRPCRPPPPGATTSPVLANRRPAGRPPAAPA